MPENRSNCRYGTNSRVVIAFTDDGELQDARDDEFGPWQLIFMTAFKDGEFDYVIDKALLDAIICGPEP